MVGRDGPMALAAYGKTPLAGSGGAFHRDGCSASLMSVAHMGTSVPGFQTEVVVAAFAQANLVAFDTGDLAELDVVVLVVARIRPGQLDAVAVEMIDGTDVVALVVDNLLVRPNLIGEAALTHGTTLLTGLAIELLLLTRATHAGLLLAIGVLLALLRLTILTGLALLALASAALILTLGHRFSPRFCAGRGGGMGSGPDISATPQRRQGFRVLVATSAGPTAHDGGLRLGCDESPQASEAWGET